MNQQSHKYRKEEKKKGKISSAQWAHLTVLSAQCCYIDFLIYKQYGSTSRREHVFRLTLEVALKQSVCSFDLDCLSESLSKTRLTWRRGKGQILYSHILFSKKKIHFSKICQTHCRLIAPFGLVAVTFSAALALRRRGCNPAEVAYPRAVIASLGT